MSDNDERGISGKIHGFDHEPTAGELGLCGGPDDAYRSGPQTNPTDVANKLSVAIANLGCRCTDDDTCDAHQLLDQLAPDPIDNRAEQRARPGWALSVLRNRLGLGAEQVAHSAGISTQRLGAIETLADEPTREQVAHLVTVIALRIAIPADDDAGPGDQDDGECGHVGYLLRIMEVADTEPGPQWLGDVVHLISYGRLWQDIRRRWPDRVGELHRAFVENREPTGGTG